ncbi:MAG: hypothetical protein AABW72_01980 [archaeon]
MNKTGMYVAVFGLMAIFTASLLLTTAYSSTKNNPSINLGDNIIKVKKAWQNFYITADRISSDEFGKIVTDICPAGNENQLKNTLKILFDQLVGKISGANISCTYMLDNITITENNPACNLSINLRVNCTQAYQKDSKAVMEIRYNKNAELKISKQMQP